jgi:glycine/D-amino acid oxidase-like deaminating enzyme
MTKMPIESPSLLEETSFWARAYGAYVPNPPLAGNASVDVAIIGGGYTGLSTAIEFKRDNPGSTVAILEAAVVGFGASGRNGGFNMTLFGLEPELTRLRWGRQRTIDAHQYTQRAVAWVKRLIEEHGLESDYRHTGMLRVSYTASQLRRLERTLRLMRELGIDDDLTFEPAEQLRADFGTDRYIGALRERETGILNPCKHVRELKRIANQAGVQVYERSPVDLIERVSGGIRLRTRCGTLSAKKLVVATNAYTSALNGLPQLRARQKPFWSYQVVTAPLDAETWASLRWIGQESFEDNRQLVHYFRPTVDGRVTMGGGDVIAPGRNHFDHDFAPHIWRHLESHLKWIFPQLREVPIDYRWGGPVSVNVDMTPQIGFLGDHSVIFSMGCIGHGVSLSHLNGRLIADLLGERKTELSEFWIVNRKAIPWPPEPLSYIGRHVIRRGLQLWDWVEERGLHSRKASKGGA